MRIAAAACLLLGAAHCGGTSPVCNLACVQPPPAVTLSVHDARGTALSAAVTISNVVVPAGTAAATATCAAQSTTVTTCALAAHAAGHYEFDLGAPGYVSQHVSADVSAPIVAPTGCCALSYVPVAVEVALSP